MANVYYSEKISLDSIKNIFLKALEDMPQKINKKDYLAIKVHFGEKGNTRFVSPKYIMPIVSELKNINENMFLTDANTLYTGMRLNATDHKKIAKEHGFEEIGIPIVIADGELGEDEEIIEVNCPVLKEVKIAKEIAKADAMVTISHFKGHVIFGFGGAIKNLGMGCGSRAGKLEMHSKLKPSIITQKCTSCGMCIKNCSVNAISISKETGKALIDSNKCMGCAKCISVCKFHSVNIPWSGNSSEESQERCAEYALGAFKNKKNIFITFLNNITQDCDCAKDSAIIGEDVGIVASIDPVSIDMAAYDLIHKHHGKDIFKIATSRNGLHIIDHSKEIGLGNKDYNLIRID